MGIFFTHNIGQRILQCISEKIPLWNVKLGVSRVPKSGSREVSRGWSLEKPRGTTRGNPTRNPGSHVPRRFQASMLKLLTSFAIHPS